MKLTLIQAIKTIFSLLPRLELILSFLISPFFPTVGKTFIEGWEIIMKCNYLVKHFLFVGYGLIFIEASMNPYH